jgi:NAD(P)-dependent dehydrogenase (short-subunit alcohol dehydrogenase family)
MAAVAPQPRPFGVKVALVTGAASGIGRASALAFARAGARVVVADVDEAGGRETVRLIADGGGEATFVRTNVTQSDEVAALVAAAVDAYGRLDCAHNNAGIGGEVADLADYPEADWHRVLAVNLTGIWFCLKHELRRMAAQGSGAIVNTASVAGLKGAAGASAYVASKHGVVGLTRTAAAEYAKAGIRVNAVCPGWIRTPMVEGDFAAHPELEAYAANRAPMRRLGTPEEVAEAVLWLCSEAASFVTGAVLVADGGLLA